MKFVLETLSDVKKVPIRVIVVKFLTVRLKRDLDGM